LLVTVVAAEAATRDGVESALPGVGVIVVVGASVVDATGTAVDATTDWDGRGAASDADPIGPSDVPGGSAV